MNICLPDVLNEPPCCINRKDFKPPIFILYGGQWRLHLPAQVPPIRKIGTIRRFLLGAFQMMVCAVDREHNHLPIERIGGRNARQKRPAESGPRGPIAFGLPLPAMPQLPVRIDPENLQMTFDVLSDDWLANQCIL